MWKRILNILLALLYLSFALVQFNDPDGWIWIIGYGIAMVLAGLAVTKRFFPKITLGLLVVGVALMLYHAPGLFAFLTNDDGIRFSEGMSNDFQYIEKAREFGGLLIANLGLWWLFHQARKST
ncbi:MAG: transmembrane 220 family protein [Bacteroidota bacterium]